VCFGTGPHLPPAILTYLQGHNDYTQGQGEKNLTLKEAEIKGQPIRTQPRLHLISGLYIKSNTPKRSHCLDVICYHLGTRLSWLCDKRFDFGQKPSEIGLNFLICEIEVFPK
jgi:hypothetical protein